MERPLAKRTRRPRGLRVRFSLDEDENYASYTDRQLLINLGKVTAADERQRIVDSLLNNRVHLPADLGWDGDLLAKLHAVSVDQLRYLLDVNTPDGRLLNAVERSDLESVARALADGADPMLALEVAAKQGDLPLLMSLIDMLSRDKLQLARYPELYSDLATIALVNEHQAMLGWLQSMGAEVSWPDVLLLASSEGALPVVELSLTGHGLTRGNVREAISLAIDNGHWQVVDEFNRLGVYNFRAEIDGALAMLEEAIWSREQEQPARERLGKITAELMTRVASEGGEETANSSRYRSMQDSLLQLETQLVAIKGGEVEPAVDSTRWLEQLVRTGNSELIRKTLQLRRANEYTHPLGDAIKLAVGNEQLLKKLLPMATVEEVERGLLAAASDGNMESLQLITQWLVKQRAGESISAPLLEAVQTGLPSVVQFVIEHFHVEAGELEEARRFAQEQQFWQVADYLAK